MKKRGWTLYEIEQLKELTKERINSKEIANILNRTVPSVSQMMKRQKIYRFKWTEEELKALEKQIFQTSNSKEIICKTLNISLSRLNVRLRKNYKTDVLNKLRYKEAFPRQRIRFTDMEIEFIKENYYEKGILWCAEKLGRTRIAVKSKALKLQKQGHIFKITDKKRWNEYLRTNINYSNKYRKKYNQEKR